jgi:spore coat polysaccharide biosynthesis protein SpsF (cytidylyltransferase family)/ubiquinone/menaquinone biosynthesis C-methylase UbiE
MYKSKKILAIIQATADDLYDSQNPNDYAIGTIKSIKLFDDIVIACPDTKESEQIEKMAKLLGVDCFRGSIKNVLDRFLTVSEKYKPDVIARIQLRAFWVDSELIKETFELLQNDVEYVDYHHDVNYSLGIDLFTYKALIKCHKLITSMSDINKKITFEFSPWVLMQDKSKFNVATLIYKKKWDKEKVKKIKSKLCYLIGNDENKQSVTPENPGPRYRMARSFLEAEDIVLDIACGKGGGTKYCSNYCKKIYGVDYNLSYIKSAQSLYVNDFNQKLSFHYGTDNSLGELDLKFDKVISLHTLEHVNDDNQFLNNIFKVLKKNSLLILEVPRLFEYPLGEPLWPFHEREYKLSEVRNLLINTGFEIVQEKGGNRNNYTDVNNAREVLLFIARK